MLLLIPYEFWMACERFDWGHATSDDQGRINNAACTMRKLLAQAPIGSQNRKIWDDFCQHHYADTSGGKQAPPLPPRPGPRQESIDRVALPITEVMQGLPPRR